MFRGDVNGVNSKGETALVNAIMAGNVETVDALLQWDSIDVDRPVRGQAPFVWAVLARDTHSVIMKLLHRQRSVDVNAASGWQTGEECVFEASCVVSCLVSCVALYQALF